MSDDTFFGFDWDAGNRAHCRKHGVSIAEIETLFMGNPRVAPDPAHSQEEDRLIAVGRTGKGRPLFVAFTIRRSADGGSSAPSAPVTCMPRRSKAMKRKVPGMTTDEDAEAFLQQDLSDLDFSQFRQVRFEFEKKSAQLNMRVPEPLLDAVKARAKLRGIPYTRYIRQLMERDLQQPDKKP